MPHRGLYIVNILSDIILLRCGKSDKFTAVANNVSVIVTLHTQNMSHGVKAVVCKKIIETASEGGEAADDILDSFDAADKDIIDILIIGSTGNILASGTGSMNGSFEHFNADGAMPTVSALKSWESYKTDAFFVSKPILVIDI